MRRIATRSAECTGENIVWQFITTGVRISGFLAAMAVSAMASAAPPNWEYVASGSHLEILVDIASIKVRGGHLTAWVMWNYEETQQTDGYPKKNYRSSIDLEAFDCNSERWGVMSTSHYSGNSGEGETVWNHHYAPEDLRLVYVTPGTVAAALLEFVCRHTAKAKPSTPPQRIPKPASKPATEQA